MIELHTSRLVRAGATTGTGLVVADGVVRAVGESEELKSSAGVDHVVDHGDAVVVPGIRDAHFHPVSYAAVLTGTELKSAVDLHDVFTRLETAAAALPAGQPLIAHRIDDETLAGHRLPTAAELDRVTGERPTIVMRYCGHVAIANTAALRTAGIAQGSADPADGIIDRNEDGTPTGVLREGAVDLVTARLGTTGPVTADDVGQALRALAGLGITSIGAMLRTGYGPLGGGGDEVALLAAIADDLPLRVHAYVIAADEGELSGAVQRLDGRSSRLRWRGFKGFADGSFGGHTAAMFEPYADADTTGSLLLSDIDRAVARAAVAGGGDVALHAIGDRAASAVLDFFEELMAEGVPPTRLRMEHASVLTEHDIERMGRMGVGAAVQPAFLHSEACWIEARVGEARLTTTYAFRTLLAAGVRLAGSSDCPVEPPDPWAAIKYARTRQGVAEDERLDATAAFALYTSGGADLLGEPPPLAIGSPADFIVIDRDPVTSRAEDVAATRVHRTYVEGDEVDLDGTGRAWPG